MLLFTNVEYCCVPCCFSILLVPCVMDSFICILLNPSTPRVLPSFLPSFPFPFPFPVPLNRPTTRADMATAERQHQAASGVLNRVKASTKAVGTMVNAAEKYQCALAAANTAASDTSSPPPFFFCFFFFVNSRTLKGEHRPP